MNNLQEVFCTVDLGAVSLSLEELLKLQAGDNLLCKDLSLPFEGALRVNGSIWAYATIDHTPEEGLSIVVNKIARAP